MPTNEMDRAYSALVVAVNRFSRALPFAIMERTVGALGRVQPVE